MNMVGYTHLELPWLKRDDEGLRQARGTLS